MPANPTLRHRAAPWLPLLALLPVACSTTAPHAAAGAQHPPPAAVARVPQAPNATAGGARPGTASAALARQVALLDRLSFGVNGRLLADAEAQGGVPAWLDRQLHPAPGDDLPPEVQARLRDFLYWQQPLEPLVLDLEHQRKAARELTDETARKQALDGVRETSNRMGREAQLEMLWRATYSREQLRELMTAFWTNHFSVFTGKGDVPLLAADYVDRAIRPNVFGRFEDLLRASAQHPAMLRYLDNDRNAAGHRNENFARELLELHTLGVDGGYTQADVQELARALSGFGVWNGEDPPRPARNQDAWRRQGLFEYRPNRHDFGDKLLLGQPLHARGWGEFNEVIARLAHHPATIRHVSEHLATFLLGHPPGPDLMAALRARWLATDGDLRELTLTVIRSREFDDSLGTAFKSPQRFVTASIRLAYQDRAVLNLQPALNWLNRMQDAPLGHSTPEGYPLVSTAWTGPGQFATRFEIARQLGFGSAGLFRSEGAKADDQAAFPQLATAYYYRAIEPGLGGQTRDVLAQARTPQEWSLLLLASPEMMRN